MLEAIREETILPEHKDLGMFFLGIMSHGTQQLVIGVDENAVKVNDIYALVSAKGFPKMFRKPKMIVFQTCQGGIYRYIHAIIFACNVIYYNEHNNIATFNH